MSHEERIKNIHAVKQQLLSERGLAEQELIDAKAALAACKEKFAKNPYVKPHTTHSDRKDEIAVFLARRTLDKNSVLRQKGERTFEIEQEQALERERQKREKQLLIELKNQYVEERSVAKSVIRVELNTSKKILKKAARGEWTGTKPLSRVKGEALISKKGTGPKDRDLMEARFPHSLFDRSEAKK